jgi:hypothetical protein
MPRRIPPVVAAAALLLFASAAPGTGRPGDAPPADAYWPSTLCRGCHDRIADQHAESMHARSFTNPVFRAQYFDEVLPQITEEPDLQWEADMCIACHSPIAYVTHEGGIVREEQVDAQMSGVTCDFCHTMPGYKGERPGNANYVSEPGDRKLGPFAHENDWHHVYSEFITTSEFCAVCHNFVNHLGLEIRSTYSEWRASRYAEEGIECQDCHMSVDGFLTAGKPKHESGQAARMALARAPYRGVLYTHRFPGAHSRSQVTGALALEIETDEAEASPGDYLDIQLRIDNSRTGHKMPSGSPELRLLWLDVRAHYGGTVVSIPATPERESDPRDVSGVGRYGSDLLKSGVPEGKRVYRAIYADVNGRRTLSSYRAAMTVFDNRINAAEIRTEAYGFEVPGDAEGVLVLVAKLYYLSYPGSFAESLGVPAAEPVEIAAARKELVVTGRPRPGAGTARSGGSWSRP